MIILDTNIISELMKTSPDDHVIRWLDEQDPITLCITSVTIAEITYGLDALPAGKRREYLEEAFNQVIVEAFKHRVMSFDVAAAHIYGKLMGRRKTAGRPLSILDGQIAAIAKANQTGLATRNIRDFFDCELNLINPFEAE